MSINNFDKTLRILTEKNVVLTPGTKVQVSGGSGLASDKKGTIVDRSKIKTDGKGVPTNCEGNYKPVDWDKEVAIKLDDGKLITMFKNRVKVISEARKNDDEYGDWKMHRDKDEAIDRKDNKEHNGTCTIAIEKDSSTGEFRVPAEDGYEDGAYYTDDKKDAIDTCKTRYGKECNITFRSVKEFVGGKYEKYRPGSKLAPKKKGKK
jgi:hypothetical protein